MAKSELGTKRICPTTGKKFYDLNKTPVISPYTGEVVPIAAGCAGPRRARPPRRAAAPLPRPSDAGARRGRRVGLAGGGRRRGEHRQGQDRRPKSEDDIEIDESLDDDEDDDSTFIADEEEGDEDVTDIIGDVGRRRGDLRSALNCDSGFCRSRSTRDLI